MGNLPLIMQNLTNSQLFATTLNNVKSQGNLKTGRGKIVMIGAGFVGTGSDGTRSVGPCRNLSLSIDGIQVIDKDSLLNYYMVNLTTNQNRLFQNSYFTNYNEGASFEAELNNYPINTGSVDFTPAPDAGFIFASYEGFKFFNPNYGKKYNSYNRQSFGVKFDGNEALSANPIVNVSGILPKNRGKIIGFQINYATLGPSAFSWTTNGNCEPLTFSINGVTIIENVPATYFSGVSGAHKDFYFDEPIEGGQQFNLDIVYAFTTSQGSVSVTFFYE